MNAYSNDNTTLAEVMKRKRKRNSRKNEDENERDESNSNTIVTPPPIPRPSIANPPTPRPPITKPLNKVKTRGPVETVSKMRKICVGFVNTWEKQDRVVNEGDDVDETLPKWLVRRSRNRRKVTSNTVDQIPLKSWVRKSINRVQSTFNTFDDEIPLKLWVTRSINREKSTSYTIATPIPKFNLSPTNSPSPRPPATKPLKKIRAQRALSPIPKLKMKFVRFELNKNQCLKLCEDR